MERGVFLEFYHLTYRQILTRKRWRALPRYLSVVVRFRTESTKILAIRILEPIHQAQKA